MSITHIGTTYYPTLRTFQVEDRQAMVDTADSATTGLKDQVSLSSSGRLLASLPPLFSSEIEADGCINLQEMRQVLQEKSSDFQEEVNARLADLGVDTSEPLELISDSRGRVRVVSDSADKEAIESMFAEDPELSNQFRQISALGSLIKASENHLEFAADYAQNPQDALAKHAFLFSTLQPTYLVRLDTDGVSMVE